MADEKDEKLAENQKKLLDAICLSLYVKASEKGVRYDGHSKNTTSISTKTGDERAKDVYQNQLFGYSGTDSKLTMYSYMPPNMWKKALELDGIAGKNMSIDRLVNMLGINLAEYHIQPNQLGNISIKSPIDLSTEKISELELPDVFVAGEYQEIGLAKGIVIGDKKAAESAAAEAKKAAGKGIDTAQTADAGKAETVNGAMALLSASQTLDTLFSLMTSNEPFDGIKRSEALNFLDILTKAVDEILHQNKLTNKETNADKQNVEKIAAEAKKITETINKLKERLNAKQPIEKTDLEYIKTMYGSFMGMQTQLVQSVQMNLGIMLVPVAAAYPGMGFPGVGPFGPNPPDRNRTGNPGEEKGLDYSRFVQKGDIETEDKSQDYEMPESLRACARVFGSTVPRALLRDKQHIQPKVTVYSGPGTVIRKDKAGNPITTEHAATIAQGSIIDVTEQEDNFLQILNGQVRPSQVHGIYVNPTDISYSYTLRTKEYMFEGMALKQEHEGFDDEDRGGVGRLYELVTDFGGSRPIGEIINSYNSGEHEFERNGRTVKVGKIVEVNAGTGKESNHLFIKFINKNTKQIEEAAIPVDGANFPNKPKSKDIAGNDTEIDVNPSMFVLDNGKIKLKLPVVNQEEIKTAQTGVEKIKINKGFATSQDINTEGGEFDQHKCYGMCETSGTEMWHDNVAKDALARFGSDSNFVDKVALLDNAYKSSKLQLDMERGMAASERLSPDWCEQAGKNWAEKMRKRVDTVAILQEKISKLKQIERDKPTKFDKNEYDSLVKEKTKALDSLENDFAFVCLEFHGSIKSKGQYAQSFLENLTKHMYKLKMVDKDGKIIAKEGNILDDKLGLTPEAQSDVQKHLDEIKKLEESQNDIEKKLELDLKDPDKHKEIVNKALGRNEDGTVRALQTFLGGLENNYKAQIDAIYNDPTLSAAERDKRIAALNDNMQEATADLVKTDGDKFAKELFELKVKQHEEKLKEIKELTKQGLDEKDFRQKIIALEEKYKDLAIDSVNQLEEKYVADYYGKIKSDVKDEVNGLKAEIAKHRKEIGQIVDEHIAVDIQGNHKKEVLAGEKAERQPIAEDLFMDMRIKMEGLIQGERMTGLEQKMIALISKDTDPAQIKKIMNVVNVVVDQLKSKGIADNIYKKGAYDDKDQIKKITDLVQGIEDDKLRKGMKELIEEATSKPQELATYTTDEMRKQKEAREKAEKAIKKGKVVGHGF